MDSNTNCVVLGEHNGKKYMLKPPIIPGSCSGCVFKKSSDYLSCGHVMAITFNNKPLCLNGIWVEYPEKNNAEQGV